MIFIGVLKMQNFIVAHIALIHAFVLLILAVPTFIFLAGAVISIATDSHYIDDHMQGGD
jgi:hypothetical protein